MTLKRTTSPFAPYRLLAGGLVAAALPLLPADIARAQQPQPQPTQQGSASPAPVKTETTTFENWVLTCQEWPAPPGTKAPKRNCWALLRVTEAKTNKVVFVIKIGLDSKDVSTIGILAPTGVVVRDGMDLKLGRNTHKLLFQWCGPKECEASAPFSQAIANELTSNKDAHLSFQILDGRQIDVSVALAGVEKVLGSVKIGG